MATVVAKKNHSRLELTCSLVLVETEKMREQTYRPDAY